MYALIDCNNFFVSCERVFRPDLKNKPVVVLSNNDGCIISRSNEAKAFGIKMGEPYFKAKPMIEKHNVAVFSSNYSLYGDMSHRVMQVLSQFSPDIEIYSIDEAFLSLSGFKHNNLHEYSREIREHIYKWTGIPVSIGIAETKTLSKAAAHFAKKEKGLNGTLLLDNSKMIDIALDKLDVGDVWGIGRRNTIKLNDIGIRTAKELTKLDNNYIRKILSISGLRTVRELKGQSCISMELIPPQKKGITVSRSFGTPVKELQSLQESIATFAAKACEKSRKEGLTASAIVIYAQTNKHRKQDAQFNGSVTCDLPYNSDNTANILAYARECTKKIYMKGYRYKKAGIMLVGLQEKGVGQLELLENIKLSDSKKEEKMMEIIDQMNNKLGNNTLFYAAQGVDNKWKPASTLVSSKYTTNWDEVLSI